MNYSVHINQLALSHWRGQIDATDALIVSHIERLCNSKAERVQAMKNADGWAWVDHGHLLEENPLLGFSSRALRARIDKLKELGVIDGTVEKVHGNVSRAYYAMSQEYHEQVDYWETHIGEEAKREPAAEANFRGPRKQTSSAPRKQTSSNPKVLASARSGGSEAPPPSDSPPAISSSELRRVVKVETGRDLVTDLSSLQAFDQLPYPTKDKRKALIAWASADGGGKPLPLGWFNKQGIERLETMKREREELERAVAKTERETAEWMQARREAMAKTSEQREREADDLHNQARSKGIAV